MAKAELKGRVLMVGPVEQVGQNNLKKQIVHLLVAAYRDQFGEIKGNDEVWQLDVLGDSVERLGMNEQSTGRLGTATVFFNSNTVRSKETGKDMYIVNTVLHKFEVKA